MGWKNPARMDYSDLQYSRGCPFNREFCDITFRDMVAAVKLIQRNGLEVSGGFIVGFDNDAVSIFKTQIDFIQKSGIVTAMVGILNAPKGSRLYQRLKREKHLVGEITGENTDFTLYFVPRMNPNTLISGYKLILSTIYAPENYYSRIKTLLKKYKPKTSMRRSDIKWSLVQGFFNCL